MSEEKIFVMNLPFLTDSLKPPAKHDKCFLSMHPKSSFLYAVNKSYTLELTDSSTSTHTLTPRIVNISAAGWVF